MSRPFAERASIQVESLIGGRAKALGILLEQELYRAINTIARGTIVVLHTAYFNSNPRDPDPEGKNQFRNFGCTPAQVSLAQISRHAYFILGCFPQCVSIDLFTWFFYQRSRILMFWGFYLSEGILMNTISLLCADEKLPCSISATQIRG